MGAVVRLGAFLLLGAATLAGCGSDTVQVQAPELHGAAARSCARLVKRLPDSVADQDRRASAPPSYTAAWGDPPIALSCGVAAPAGFTPTSLCQVVNGVGWFIDRRQLQGDPEDLVMTTVDRAQRVRVRLPRDYWPPAAAMVDLASAIKQSLPQTRPCL